MKLNEQQSLSSYFSRARLIGKNIWYNDFVEEFGPGKGRSDDRGRDCGLSFDIFQSGWSAGEASHAYTEKPTLNSVNCRPRGFPTRNVEPPPRSIVTDLSRTRLKGVTYFAHSHGRRVQIKEERQKKRTGAALIGTSAVWRCTVKIGSVRLTKISLLPKLLPLLSC